MKVICHPNQCLHYPPGFLVNGVFRPNPEVQERYERLLHGAQAAGCTPEAPTKIQMRPIEAIHPARYLKFLQHAFERWKHIDGAAEAVTPNVHPDSRDAGYPSSVVAQAGYHMSDLAAPIVEHTWDSVLWSAQSAIHAADLVLEESAMAYALCRPPGHHASADMAGGFCYLNNSAIAAGMLRDAGGKVAILDVDLHHGNGTQSIFYERNDVLTVSIHADPDRFYPFFWGYADETGKGAGKGFNLNLPIPRGSDDAEFLAALDQALDRIDSFAPDMLVVALGLDSFEGDPFGGLRVSTEGFHAIGTAVSAALTMPTLIVQEGGYLCDELENNLTQFLLGIGSGPASTDSGAD